MNACTRSAWRGMYWWQALALRSQQSPQQCFQCKAIMQASGHPIGAHARCSVAHLHAVPDAESLPTPPPHPTPYCCSPSAPHTSLPTHPTLPHHAPHRFFPTPPPLDHTLPPAAWRMCAMRVYRCTALLQATARTPPWTPRTRALRTRCSRSSCARPSSGTSRYILEARRAGGRAGRKGRAGGQAAAAAAACGCSRLLRNVHHPPRVRLG